MAYCTAQFVGIFSGNPPSTGSIKICRFNITTAIHCDKTDRWRTTVVFQKSASQMITPRDAGQKHAVLRMVNLNDNGYHLLGAERSGTAACSRIDG